MSTKTINCQKTAIQYDQEELVSRTHKTLLIGVPAAVQWVKNLTAMTLVAMEVWVQPPAPEQWVKGSGIAAAAA